MGNRLSGIVAIFANSAGLNPIAPIDIQLLAPETFFPIKITAISRMIEIKYVGIANCLKDFIGNEYVIKNNMSAANPQTNCL